MSTTPSSPKPVDVTTTDGQFRFAGTPEEPDLIRFTVTGQFRRLLPIELTGDGRITEGAVAAVVHAFASDLAAARAQLAEKDAKIANLQDRVDKMLNEYSNPNED